MSVGLTYFSVNGYTSPGAAVSLQENLAVIATAVADSGGNFSLSLLSEEGLHTYNIYTTDVNGIHSSSVSQNVALSPGLTTTLGNLVLPPTLVASSLESAPNTNIELSGFAHPASTVLVFFGGELVASLSTGPSGHYSASISTGSRSPGQYSLTVRNTLGSGHSSLDSVTHLITITPDSDDQADPTDPTDPTDPADLPSPSPSPSPILPWWLRLFDLDGDLRLTLDELKLSITSWVRAWTDGRAGDCDLNLDELCDLTDLSILLYYFEN